jgi:CDP-diacylglycerol--glycerol-3-phosphate 3-phosphatidyltransferase
MQFVFHLKIVITNDTLLIRRRFAHGPAQPMLAGMANLFTLGRIALIIPFAAMFLANAQWNMKAAFVIFVVAAVTDFFDGWIARTRNEVSALGAALDPLADKLLIAAALILLLRNGIIAGAGVIAVLIIILREILISGLREAVTLRGGSLKVTQLAKWKTTAQLIAAGLLLAAAPHGFAGEPLRPLASGALWLAAVLTFWTGADYAYHAARMLRAKNT